MATAPAAAGGSASPAPYSTPTKRAAFVNAEAGPSRARPSGASPAYSSRRHSLYGIEDRIVIDPGSRLWKVGFSGEVDTRAVFNAVDEAVEQEAWDLDLGHIVSAREDRAEAKRLIAVRILKQLRSTYTRQLMTDPKARKVIVVESTFLPTYVKDEMAKTLFETLKVPSVSFAPASVLALASCGRVTGLVIDCGWLETTVTPVYHSRPLFHLARSTPLAGRRLHRRLKALLRHHARYYAPPTSLSSPTRQAVQPVPNAVLSDELVTRIFERGCFVSRVMTEPFPPSSRTGDAELPDEWDDEDLMARLQARYIAGADATDMRFSLRPLSTETQGMGPSTLLVPGWLRERAAEVLFGDDEGEADTLPELVSSAIQKLPVDLRTVMVSSMLVSGGTASLPGFIPRLRISLLQLLLPPTSAESSVAESVAPLHTQASRLFETKAWRRRHDQPYRELYPLSDKLAILNDPCPLDGGGGGRGGCAPMWRPGLMSCVGGSLAGALKTGGPEILREEYDASSLAHVEKGAAYRRQLAEEAAAAIPDLGGPTTVVEPVSATAGAADLSTAAHRIIEGVQIEDLLPGMAIGGAVRRKRGWTADARMADWTRVVRA